MEGEKNQYQGQEEEVKSRGMFDFMKKKDDTEAERVKKFEEENVVTGMENIHVTEPEVEKIEVESKEEDKEEVKKGSLLEKLHRSDSSSSSSSDEEEIGSDGEKRKKKKGLKEKMKEKFVKNHKNETEIKTTTIVNEEALVPPPSVTYTSPPAIHTSTPETHTSPPPPYSSAPANYEEEDTSIKVEKVDEVIKVEDEKKGFLEKIKEKLPGQKKEESVPVPVAVIHEETDNSDGKEKKGFLGKMMDKIPGYNKTGTGEQKEGENKASESH